MRSALIVFLFPLVVSAQEGVYRLESSAGGDPLEVILEVTRQGGGLRLARRQQAVETKDARPSYAEGDLSSRGDGFEARIGGQRFRYRFVQGRVVEDGPAGRLEGAADHPVLKLVAEARLSRLLGRELERYEASGVVRAGAELYVVFDNDRRIGVLRQDLVSGRLVAPTDKQKSSDFEGISWDPRRRQFYVVVEAREHDGELLGRLWTLDRGLQRQERSWLSGQPLRSDGKGFEGLAYVRRGGQDHLLALLEGNHGAKGERALERGHGRVAVFKRHGADDWRRAAVLELAGARFSDYSGIDVDAQGRIAVVSQTSALLWVGRLATDGWKVEGGQTYRFPRDGVRERYGTLEGVTWLGERRLALVSDRPNDQLEGYQGREQGVHIFALPE